MIKIDLKKIKELREATSAPIMECKKALKICSADMKKAKVWLKKQGLAKVAKKKGKATKEGTIYSYIHSGGKVGAMVKLTCQTDFVAKNDEFQRLIREICMQIAAMKPKNVQKLLAQEYIRDPEKKIEDLLNEAIAKFGENIKIEEFVRLEV